MAGLGYKDFTAGAVLTAAQVDGYLMEQAVMNFAGTAARGSALSSVQSAGMMAHVGGGTVTVYDGSAWQQVYPAQAGLVFVAGTAFSAVSSVSVNDCFSANYDTYELIMTFTAASANTNAQIRMRAAGTDNTSANYLWHNRSSGVGQTALAFASSAAAGDTSALIASLRNDFPDGTLISVRLANPFATARTLATIQGTLNDTNLGNQRAFLNNFVVSLEVTTSYDGFTLSPVTGTFSGTVRVYGYRSS